MFGGDGFELETREPADERIAPSASFVEQANVTDEGIRDRFAANWPEGWAEAGDLLAWEQEYDAVFDADAREWFPGGRLNAAANCLDRHARERKNQRALVWEGHGDQRRSYTYLELRREVEAVAAALRELGVEAGDVVTLYLPEIPELPIAMLACARLGAPHAVVFAGFSADALQTRMAESGSEYLVVSDGYYRRGDAVSLQNRADTVRADLDQDVTTVVVDRLGTHDAGGDGHSYGGLVAAHDGERVDPVPRASTDELFLIYTSGTTGEPKRVTHTTGGYLAHAAWTSRAVLDLEPGDTHLCTANIGWITGHSYIVYGPLALGATVLLREAEADSLPRSQPWESIERHAVDICYTSPTVARTFRKWGEEYPARHDLSSLRLLGTVGEPIGPETWRWLYEHVGNEACPIVDTWWQTETGGHLITTLPGVDDMKPGAAGRPIPGVDAAVVGEDREPTPPETGGYLVIETPWPGMPRELSTGERWAETAEVLPDSDWAYPTEDGALVDEDGYVTILGRVDDVINAAGHRFGTMELESAVVGVDGVTEAAVVGGSHGNRDGGLYVYAKRDDSSREGDRLREAIHAAVEREIGTFARPDRVVVVPELPKTSSGKIVRRVLTDIAEGNDLGDTSALRNPEVVGEIETAVDSD
jgi:acetyl-CoA synthetase